MIGIKQETYTLTLIDEEVATFTELISYLMQASKEIGFKTIGLTHTVLLKQIEESLNTTEDEL